MSSLSSPGYLQPIIVNRRDNTVVGGHQRLKVLKDLGYEQVDVVFVDVTMEREKSLNLALNKIVGEWDEPKLARLLQEFEGFSVFAVEGNHFQELMIGNLKRRVKEAGVSLRVYTIKSRSNKQSRIASLEPEVTQGRIRLCRRHQLLLDQLRQFPLAVHDDGPDALEMAVTASRQLLIPQGSAEVICHIPAWARESRRL